MSAAPTSKTIDSATWTTTSIPRVLRPSLPCLARESVAPL